MKYHGSDQIIDLLAVDKEDNDDNVNIDDDEDRNVKILAQYYWVQRIESAYRIENILNRTSENSLLVRALQ